MAGWAADFEFTARASAVGVTVPTASSQHCLRVVVGGTGEIGYAGWRVL